MDRRESLKLIAWSTVSTSLIVDACKTKDKVVEKAPAKEAAASSIDRMAKDKPEFQTPMRGGLRWLDVQMVKQHNKPFKDCTQQQQIAMVDNIAYPKKAKPGMKQGVSFFTLMRNLTATGFYTTEMGIKDV